MRVALVGCSSVADPEQPLLVEALTRLGVTVAEPAWDSGADWQFYDLVVVRAAWDYVDRREEFLAWADTVARLANPASVLRWNTDKRYLAGLADRGVPVVPTMFVTASFTPPSGTYVVKPTVSAGAVGAARFGPGQDDAARRHVSGLLAAGQTVMVQPYLDGVDSAQETSVIFLGGDYSHGARKGPILSAAGVVQPEDYDIGPREPSAAERAVAQQVLAAVGERLLYARVDLLPGPDGPLLLELELTEPFLFLASSEGAADRFAAAVVRAAEQRP